MEQRQLSRTLGLGMVIVVSVANIIGSGVYKKIAPMAAELHSPGWVLVCWVLGGIISLFGALSNAEIAGLLADTGGEYVYYQKIYNRFFAFIFGWSIFTVIETAAISSLAYIFAQSVGSIIHLPPVFASMENYNIGGVFYPFAGFNIKLLAIVAIILFTWINSLGIATSAEVSAGILVLVFIGILTIIIFGLGSSHADVRHVFEMKTSSSRPVTLTAVFTSMLAAFWAYQGWAAVGYIGGEVKNAKRNIPLGIIIGVLIIIIVYLLVNTAYLSLLSIPQLEKIYNSQNSIAAVEAVRQFWGNNGVIFISGLIAVTTLSALHATILSSCRMYYAMAKEGLFFRPVARLNKAHVPGVSLWYQGIWASILVLSGTFDQLTDMIIFAVFIYYGATALGVFVLRKKMPDVPRPYKVWGYPVVPAVVVLFSAVLFFNTIFARPREAAIGMALMLTGVPLWFWFRRRK
ncbi:MAG: amino acid permease [Bacteroidetes bacterium]|nr:amino acid permease [Bacteroidota bacterium]MBS1973159.1 amino acid permease [Bacteroidota bacterium]